MTISQTFQQGYDFVHEYDNEISITEIPKGFFPAIISQKRTAEKSIREIRIELLPLEQSLGGTMTANPGRYPKHSKEKMVKVTVYHEGKEVASNTQSYPE